MSILTDALCTALELAVTSSARFCAVSELRLQPVSEAAASDTMHNAAGIIFFITNHSSFCIQNSMFSTKIDFTTFRHFVQLHNAEKVVEYAQISVKFYYNLTKRSRRGIIVGKLREGIFS